MKKLSVVALIIGSVCSLNSFAADNPDLKDTSYAVGALFGTDLKGLVDAQKGVISYDNEKLLAGVKDALAGKVDLSNKELASTLKAADAKLKQASETKQAEQAKAVKQEGDKFVAEFKKKDGVKETASGLLYRIDKEGEGAKINKEDTVKVHYTGKLPNGKVFDSSRERGQPAEFPLDRVIAGWTEGLQLVKKGGHIELVIPAKLAYGEQGAGADIPPNATLYFDVEVLDVLPKK